MNNEVMNATTTTIANCLVYNNRKATVKLDAEQIGAESLAQWKTLVKNLQRASYDVYSQCENDEMIAENSSIDKTAIFNCLRIVLNTIGEVNGHKLYANEKTAIAIIGYAGRRGNEDAPELQYCNSRISNTRKEIKAYEALNVSDKEYKATKLAEMQASLEKLEEEKAALLDTPDMRIKKPTITSESAFRLDVEHFLARTITGQMAKTLEELDAEDAARKAERKAKAKARKAAKKTETVAA